MSDAKLQYFTLICDKKKKKKFMELMTSHGAVSIETVYGRGSANAGAFAKALGLETEEHKVVLSGLIPTSQAKTLIELLEAEYAFDKHNTGIAFTTPVEGLSL